jgi:hypothetical protein
MSIERIKETLRELYDEDEHAQFERHFRTHVVGDGIERRQFNSMWQSRHLLRQLVFTQT